MKTPLSVLLRDKPGKLLEAHPNESIYDCIARMNTAQFGAILIMDEGALVGIFTERDVSKKIVLSKIDTELTPVADVMSVSLLTVHPSTTVEKAMSIVTEKRIRHLPVVENNKVVGLISIGDLTRWMVVSQQANIDQLVDYISNG